MRGVVIPALAGWSLVLEPVALPGPVIPALAGVIPARTPCLATWLDAARAEVPARTPLWPTVRAVVASLVGAWDGLPWPAAGDGPSRDALRTAARTLTELAGGLPDRSATLLSGARSGAVGYGAWDERAGSRRGWDTYLAYTTVRYLDLCLEPGRPPRRVLLGQAEGGQRPEGSATALPRPAGGRGHGH